MTFVCSMCSHRGFVNPTIIDNSYNTVVSEKRCSNDILIFSLNSNLFDVYLKPYFLEAYRPIRKGKVLGSSLFVFYCYKYSLSILCGIFWHLLQWINLSAKVLLNGKINHWRLQVDVLYCQVIGVQKEIRLNVHPSLSLIKARQGGHKVT